MPEWWREAVFYQVYPRSFQDSNGDGVGDLPGIIARLDHLNDGTPRSLGVDAIWLSPFYPSPMADFGYDVSDYCDVDPTFGTLSDFDRLLDEAHARGIRVIIDLVPNHTSDRHPWFVESRSSRDNPKRDWYIWAQPRSDGWPPNNWQSVFAGVGPAWTFDEKTGQYYLHHFLPEQPDLNWWNPAVREAMDELLRFWLDRGVDGFRLDVAHGLVKDPELRDNPRVRAGRRARQRDWDHPGVHEVLAGFRRTLDAYGERMAVGEVAVRDHARLMRYHGGAARELHLVFNFHFLDQPWRAERFRDAVARVERAFADRAWPCYTLSNHDRPRHASRFGLERARAAALMLLTLRGTPFLYYGEEIGMTDVPIPRAQALDVAGRDPERTPMQWDASPGAGFTTGAPWLPIARARRRVNVAAARDDPRSLLSLYRRLIWFRKRSAALRRGRYRALRSPWGVFAYVRETDDERLLVALNLQNRARRVAFAVVPRSARLILSTDPERDEGELDLRPLRLGPNEGVLVRIG